MGSIAFGWEYKPVSIHWQLSSARDSCYSSLSATHRSQFLIHRNARLAFNFAYGMSSFYAKRSWIVSPSDHIQLGDGPGWVSKRRTGEVYGVGVISRSVEGISMFFV